MRRTVVPPEKLTEEDEGEEAEGPLLAYRLEARLAGSGGEEVAMFAFSRAQFSEEKLELTLEHLASGPRRTGRYEVKGHPASWVTFQVQGKPAAAVTWFYPPNKLQYLIQLTGTPSYRAEELRRLLVEGATCGEMFEP